MFSGMNYPNEKKRTKKSLVKLLTSKKNSCSIILDDGSKKYPIDFVAINYAYENGDFSLYRRALEFGDKKYFIILEDKIIITKEKEKVGGNFFYDVDKIPLFNQYIFKGNFEEILEEFNFEGYRLIE